MTDRQYTHFSIQSDPNPKLEHLLEMKCLEVSDHVDDSGPYYHVQVKEEMTERQMKEMTGCERLFGVLVRPGTEREELIAEGKAIVEKNVEEDTLVRLNTRECQAVRAYMKYIRSPYLRCDTPHQEASFIYNRRRRKCEKGRKLKEALAKDPSMTLSKQEQNDMEYYLNVERMSSRMVKRIVCC